MGLFPWKNLPLRCWGCLSLLDWIGTLALSLLLKIQPENWSLDLFYQVAFYWGCSVSLYLYKCTIWPYCWHVWAGAFSYDLKLLDKLQKLICMTVGPSLAASLELLTYCPNVACLSIVCRYLNWLNWFHFLIVLELGQFVILIDCIIFLSPFLDITRLSMSTVSFLAQLDFGILYMIEYFLWPMN